MSKAAQLLRYAIVAAVPAAAAWLGLDAAGREELVNALGSIVTNIAAAYAAILGIWAAGKALYGLYQRTRGGSTQ